MELKNRVICIIQRNVRKEIEIKGDYLTLGDCRETIFTVPKLINLSIKARLLQERR